MKRQVFTILKLDLSGSKGYILVFRYLEVAKGFQEALEMVLHKS